MVTQEHLSSQYDKDLDALRTRVLQMGGLVEAQILAAIQAFTITLIVRRFLPDEDAEARWQSFDVEVYSTDRVLDALHKIKWEHDGSLTFRRSCARGVCGSDAMRINGRNRLACKTLIKDLNIDEPIYVEPIKGLEVEKDLVVDMNPFYQAYLGGAVLSGAETAPRYARLTAGDRQAILEILRDTKPDLPDYFRAAPRS